MMSILTRIYFIGWCSGQDFIWRKNSPSNKSLKNWCTETCTQYYLSFRPTFSEVCSKCVLWSINLANWRQIFVFFNSLVCWALLSIIVPKTIPRIDYGLTKRPFSTIQDYPKTSLRSKEFSNLFSILGGTFLLNTGQSCSKMVWTDLKQPHILRPHRQAAGVWRGLVLWFSNVVLKWTSDPSPGTIRNADSQVSSQIYWVKSSRGWSDTDCFNQPPRILMHLEFEYLGLVEETVSVSTSTLSRMHLSNFF